MLALLNCSNGCRSSFKETGSSLNYNKCIICQEDNKQPSLATPTSDGLKTIHNARQVWLKLRNDNFRSATDRLTDALAACPSPLIVCHNGCRVSYASSHTLERLRATDITVDQIQSSSSAPTAVAQSQEILLWSKVAQINWNVCIVCQKETKGNVHLIQEMPVSKRIIEASKYDPISGHDWPA